MTRFRIYTEAYRVEDIADMIGSTFHAFTLIEGTGYWQGKPERSLIIEIITDEKRRKEIEALAVAIKVFNRQDAVLVTEDEVTADLL